MMRNTSISSLTIAEQQQQKMIELNRMLDIKLIHINSLLDIKATTYHGNEWLKALSHLWCIAISRFRWSPTKTSILLDMWIQLQTQTLSIYQA